MNDFSAAAMLRLIRLGLKRQGLVVPSFAPPKSAHIPLTEKRSLVGSLFKEHGPIILLRIGDAIRDAPDEPMMTALMLATDPFDLFSRWQRLERFVHSKHRTRIVSQSATGLTLQHYAHTGKSPPQPEEDLLIFGLLVAMIEKIGAEGLMARVSGNSTWLRRNGQWLEAPVPNDVSTWEIVGKTPQHQNDANPIVIEGSGWLAAARSRLARDPGRLWTISSLASDLCVSPRTLQRRLRSESSSFSSLLAEVRMASAARLLGESRQSASEIGYTCGFSDQAHFTRAFKRFTAFTPQAYREHFMSER